MRELLLLLIVADKFEEESGFVVRARFWDNFVHRLQRAWTHFKEVPKIFSVSECCSVFFFFSAVMFTFKNLIR